MKYLILLSITILALTSCQVVDPVHDEVVPTETTKPPEMNPVETKSEVLNNIFSFLAIQHASTQSFKDIISDEVGYIIMAEIIKTPNDIPKALQSAFGKIINSPEITPQKKASILSSLTVTLSDPSLSEPAWLTGLNAIESMKTLGKLSAINYAPSDRKDEVIEFVFDEILEEEPPVEDRTEEPPTEDETEEPPVEDGTEEPPTEGTEGTSVEGTTIRPSR